MKLFKLYAMPSLFYIVVRLNVALVHFLIEFLYLRLDESRGSERVDLFDRNLSFYLDVGLLRVL